MSEWARRRLADAVEPARRLVVVRMLERAIGLEDGPVTLGELPESVAPYELGHLGVKSRGLDAGVAEPIRVP